MKDCFGEETKIDYNFSRPIDSALIEVLKRKYPVEIFSEFPRPFVRINLPEKFLLTGVVGLNNFRVIYRKNCPLGEQDKLENFFKRNIII